LYMRMGSLLGVPFDLGRLELRGPSVGILDNVMQAVAADVANDETGAGQFTVSENGTLAYLPGGIYPAQRAQFVSVDRTGVATVLPIRSGRSWSPRVSPDGKSIAYFEARPRSRITDVWIYDMRRQNSARLTLQAWSFWPVWAPDGKSLVVSSVMSGHQNLARVPADGSGVPERLTTGEYPQTPASWSGPANVLAFLEARVGLNQIWMLPMNGYRKPWPFLETPFQSGYPEFSPDGRWLAYVSTESGAAEVYVRPFPGTGEKIRISTNNGRAPVWARNQRELFYMQIADSTTQVMSVEIHTASGFQAGTPRFLFEGRYPPGVPHRNYDISADGQRFIMIRGSDPEPPVTQMHVVLNWAEELKRLVPTN
jgi:Tol biopolymer transport system component